MSRIFKTNRNASDSRLKKKFRLNTKNKITTQMLMKLFATKSVASNFLGLSSKRLMILAFLGCVKAASSISCWLSEKKATSDPETIAAQKSSTKIPEKPSSISKSIS